MIIYVKPRITKSVHMCGKFNKWFLKLTQHVALQYNS